MRWGGISGNMQPRRTEYGPRDDTCASCSLSWSMVCCSCIVSSSCFSSAFCVLSFSSVARSFCTCSAALRSAAAATSVSNWVGTGTLPSAPNVPASAWVGNTHLLSVHLPRPLLLLSQLLKLRLQLLQPGARIHGLHLLVSLRGGDGRGRHYRRPTAHRALRRQRRGRAGRRWFTGAWHVIPAVFGCSSGRCESASLLVHSVSAQPERVHRAARAFNAKNTLSLRPAAASASCARSPSSLRLAASWTSRCCAAALFTSDCGGAGHHSAMRHALLQITHQEFIARFQCRLRDALNERKQRELRVALGVHGKRPLRRLVQRHQRVEVGAAAAAWGRAFGPCPSAHGSCHWWSATSWRPLCTLARSGDAGRCDK